MCDSKFRIASSRQQRAHFVTKRERRHAWAHCIDGPSDLQARNVRRATRWRVQPKPLRKPRSRALCSLVTCARPRVACLNNIWSIDACGIHTNPDLVGGGLGNGPLGVADHVPSATAHVLNGPHGAMLPEGTLHERIARSTAQHIRQRLHGSRQVPAKPRKSRQKGGTGKCAQHERCGVGGVAVRSQPAIWMKLSVWRQSAHSQSAIQMATGVQRGAGCGLRCGAHITRQNH